MIAHDANLAAALASPDAAPPTKTCRGACGRTLPATVEHFYLDRGFLRALCRACHKADTLRRGRRARAEGPRVCLRCGERKPVTAFDRARRRERAVRRDTCRACATRLSRPDPVREGDASLRGGLRQGQRWAVALAILLGRRGMTLGEYRALRGEARREFEARWSALLREMAKDCGEWLAEWDEPSVAARLRPASLVDGRPRAA